MKSEQNNVTLNMDIDEDYYISGSLAINMLTFYIDLVYCFFLLFLSIYYIFAPKENYDDHLD
jgi:hypothetical protein